MEQQRHFGYLSKNLARYAALRFTTAIGTEIRKGTFLSDRIHGKKWRCTCPQDALEIFGATKPGKPLSPSTCVHGAEPGKVVIKKRTQRWPQATESLFVALDTALTGEFADLTPKRIFSLTESRRAQIESENGMFFEATEFIENDPVFDWQNPQWQESHGFAMGQILHRFHQASDKIVLALPKRTQRELSSLLPQLPATLPSQLARCESAKMFDSSWRQQLVDSATSAVEKLKERSSASEHIIVHGDYHPGNALFMGNRTIALIDFDFAHFEPLEFDLAYATIVLSFPSLSKAASSQTSATPGKMQLEMARSFLQGYLSQSESLGSSKNIKWLDQPFDSVLHHLQPYTTLSAILIFVWMLDQGTIDSESTLESLSIFEALFTWLSPSS